MKKKIFKSIGYFFFGLIVYIISLIYTLPYNSLIPIVANIVKRETGMILNIKSIKPSFPTTIIIEKIKLKENKSVDIYDFDLLKLSVPIKSLIAYSPELSFSGKRGLGHIEGVFYLAESDKLGIIYKISSPSVKYLIPEKESFKIEGVLSLSGEFLISIIGYNLDLNSIEKGDLTLTINSGNINIPSIPIPSLANIPFKSIKGKAKFSGKRIQITKLDVKGMIDANVKGEIILKQPFANTRINLKLRFKPSASVIESAGPLISLLNNKKGRDGFYNIDIKGTFNGIKPII